MAIIVFYLYAWKLLCLKADLIPVKWQSQLTYYFVFKMYDTGCAQHSVRYPRYKTWIFCYCRNFVLQNASRIRSLIDFCWRPSLISRTSVIWYRYEWILQITCRDSRIYTDPGKAMSLIRLSIKHFECHHLYHTGPVPLFPWHLWKWDNGIDLPYLWSDGRGLVTKASVYLPMWFSSPNPHSMPANPRTGASVPCIN